MYLHEMGKRQPDVQGAGHYGASRSRGTRTHKGIDLCNPDDTHLPIGTEVQCGFSGEVVKVGLAYSDTDKRHLRYVAIKLDNWYARIFYINPTVKVGDKVTPDMVIGTSLELGRFYKGITEHVHFEVYKLRSDKEGMHNKRNFIYVDPNVVLEFMR